MTSGPVLRRFDDGSVGLWLPSATVASLSELLRRMWWVGREAGHALPPGLHGLWDLLHRDEAETKPTRVSSAGWREVLVGAPSMAAMRTSEAAAELGGLSLRRVQQMVADERLRSPRRGWVLSADVEAEVRSRASRR